MQQKQETPKIPMFLFVFLSLIMYINDYNLYKVKKYFVYIEQYFYND